ncbi:hypothetical protein QJS04_geneDACA017677 [Acorus gramineus]|uniref:Uncharacterized protein n=1 Tax=Acorus gramineus TaxID=55184 RepID=A0AAV9BY22_ACOGR|nr:hypothetical protein QJS04_geneDACA017677 [Acorus gramineus]
MYQYWYLLIDRVGAHQKLALLHQVLFHVLVLHPFARQRYSHPYRERAHQKIQ